MSENEKAITGLLCNIAAGKPVTQAEAERVAGEFDALLAERRAEVDELRQDVERWKALAAGTKAGALEVYAAGEVDARLSSARDAALEEAAQIVPEYERMWRHVAATMRDTETQQRWLKAAEVVGDVADAIRALQSAPASVVQVAKVREVLKAEHDATHLAGTRIRFRQAARRLGVDLDATGGNTQDTQDEVKP